MSILEETIFEGVTGEDQNSLIKSRGSIHTQHAEWDINEIEKAFNGTFMRWQALFSGAIFLATPCSVSQIEMYLWSIGI